MNTEKKYQIFISSTYEDLKEERETIIATILSMYHIPIGMELFSADDDEQWNIIEKTIDDSDYYILIIGTKYGSMNSEGISYTEMEYNYAKKINIPIYSFILDKSASRTSEQMENDGDKLTKLNLFKDKVKNNDKMLNFWKDKNDLGRLVSISLQKAFRKKPRIGWIKASNAASTEVLSEISSLSKDNRFLRDQLEQYKLTSQRVPQLSISFNQDIQLHEPEKNNFITISKIDKTKLEKELTENLSEEIDTYNSNLPSQDIIDKYNNQMLKYNNLKINSIIGYKINIKNNGNLRATNIYIKIYLPEEIYVFENYDDMDSFKPNKIDLPKDPVTKYINKKLDRLSNSLNNWSALQISSGKITSPMITNGLYTANYNHWVKIHDNHTFTLFRSKLMHTQTIEFDEYVLSFIKEGTYNIKYEIICEEYLEKAFGNININCSK